MTKDQNFASDALETNSGSPLGAICSTVGVEPFDFACDEALRFDAFVAERWGAFAGDALAFFRAGAFLAFWGLATLRAFTAIFLEFLRFPPVAISRNPLTTRGQYIAIRFAN
jgi:hypothetical protein